MALLANTLATGAMLVTLILIFGPVSGGHFNPAVSLANAWQGGLPWREVPGYVSAQLVGGFAGVAAAATVLFRWLVPLVPNEVSRFPAHARRD